MGRAAAAIVWGGGAGSVQGIGFWDGEVDGWREGRQTGGGGALNKAGGIRRWGKRVGGWGGNRGWGEGLGEQKLRGVCAEERMGSDGRWGRKE